MADSQVKTANLCNITSSTLLRPNAGGSGTYIADNSISVHMTNRHRESGIYISSLPEQSVIGGKYTISFVPVCAINNVMLVVLYGATTQISFTSGNRYTLTITATAADNTMAFYGGDTVEKTVIIKDIQIEKGENATPYRPYSATGWLHSLRKLATATEAVENPLYSDGTAITAYTLKGNTVQNGTPSPTTPIQPQECGERTGNLFDLESWLISNGAVFSKDGNAYTFSAVQSMFSTPFYFSDTDIPVSISGIMTGITAYNVRINLIRADGTTAKAYAVATNVTKSENIVCAGLNFDWSIPGTMRIDSLMLNLGSTPLPYEPYGYKIPISSGGVITNIYLGSTQTVRRIKKLVLDGTENYGSSGANTWLILGTSAVDFRGTADGAICSHVPLVLRSDFTTNTCAWGGGQIGVFLINIDNKNNAELISYIAQQYANGTPVCVWYVLETETTGIVNEPIRKIGDYADTVSGITIPTIAGANTLSVDTAVQPSEFTATWTGWHNASVQEWDGSEWQ